MKLPYMPSRPIFSLAASRDRASRTQSPDKDAERLTNAISGQTPLESLAKWDHDSSCWRTFQASLLTDTLAQWLGSFPKQGMTVSGTAYRLRPLVPRTSVGGGGVWPTPGASKASTDTMLTVSGDGREKPNKLGWAVAVFPTPNTLDYQGNRVNGNANTKQWGGVNSLGGMAKTGLWPTPTQRDRKDGDAHSCQNVPVNGLLGRAVHWPTPQERDYKGAPGAGSTERGGHQSSLPREVNGQLNPEFVTWLMGLPQGWTSLELLPPEHWQRWLRGGHWADGEWPSVPRVAQGVKDRVARLRALGNGIVPACLAKFLRSVT